MFQSMLDQNLTTIKSFIEVMVNSLKEEIKDLRNENDEIKHSLQFTQDQLKDALSELVTQKKLNQACSEAQSKTGKLLERVRILEDNSKKNNVVINGIPTMKDENGEGLLFMYANF